MGVVAEPMTGWPRCGDTLRLHEPEPIVCLLPLHHQMDGQRMHDNRAGVKWERIGPGMLSAIVNRAD